MPHSAAGWRIEPPVSEPRASVAMRAATAAAEVPLHQLRHHLRGDALVQASRSLLGPDLHQDLGVAEAQTADLHDVRVQGVLGELLAERRDDIERRLANGTLTPAAVERLSRQLDLEFDEHCVFQSTKSLAVLEGHLSLDIGMELYALLGESPATFNGQDLATKVVCTALFERLLRED